MAGSIIGALRVTLGLDTAAFDQGAAKAKQQASGLKGALLSTAAGFSPFAVGAAAGAAAAGAFALGMKKAAEAAQFADDLAAMANKIGISAEALQEFRHAGERVDIDAAKMDEALRALNGTLGALQTHVGDGKIRKAFEELGIPQSTIEKMNDASDLLPVLADKVSKLGTQAAQVQIARKLGIEELLPLLQQGADGVARLTGEARSLGLVLGEETVSRLADMSEQIRIADERARIAGLGFGASFTPALVAMKNAAADAFDWMGRLIDRFNAIQNRSRATLNTQSLQAFFELEQAHRLPKDSNIRKWREEAAQKKLDAINAELNLRDVISEHQSAAAASARGSGGYTPKAGSGKPRTAYDWDKMGKPQPLEIDRDTIVDLTKIDPRSFDAFRDQLKDASGKGLMAGANEALAKSRDDVREGYRWAIAGGLEAAVYGGGKGLMHYLADQFRMRLIDSLADGLATIFEQMKFSGGGGFGGTIAAGAKLFGFAGGGSFQVGGSGGIDSQLVQFKASPNERVTVTKPGQDGGALGGLVITVDKSNYFDVAVRRVAAPLAAQAGVQGAVGGAGLVQRRIVKTSRQQLGVGGV